MNSHGIAGCILANPNAHRPKTQARIVVTFLVEIPESEMRSMPGWKQHAVNYFRAMYGMTMSPQELVASIRRRKSIKILSETVEIAR